MKEDGRINSESHSLKYCKMMGPININLAKSLLHGNINHNIKIIRYLLIQEYFPIGCHIFHAFINLHVL